MSLRPGPRALQIGAWIADPADDSLTRGAERLRIDPRAMQLLLRLARSPGEVLSQNVLLDDVWTGVIVSPASVYQTISQLRKALGDTETPPSYIETVARKGYRLVARVAPITAAAISAADSGRAVDGDAKSAGPSRRRKRRWIAAGIVLLAALGGAWLLRPVAAQPDSIVVLPFVDMTPGKTEQAFCDGMTEELSNWLAQIPGLRVVARTSAFAFRNKEQDAREIGRQLGATHLLEGSLRRSGNMLRVTVQLIEARTGYHRWSRDFDMLVDDVLQTQEQIARQVAANMQMRLTLETDERFSQRRSKLPQANRAYVLARAHQRRETRVDNAQAISLYRQALSIDPQFSLAQIGLITAYMNQQQFEERTLEDIGRDVEPLLTDLGKRATDLADFYIVRGTWRNDHLERAGAIEDLLHALEIDPESSKAAAMLGYVYLTMGEPNAAEGHWAAAAALEPFNANVHSSWCMTLTDLGQFAEAREKCDRARALEPESQSALSAISDLEDARGDAAAALKWTTVALHGSNEVGELHSDRGRWLMRLGLVQEAHRAYDAAVAATGDVGGKDLGLAMLGLRSTFAVEGAAGVRSLITRGGMDSTDDPEHMFQLAESELMMGNARAARSYTDKALASDTLHPEKLASPWDARSGRSCLLIAAAAESATGGEALAAQHLATVSGLVETLVKAGMRRHDVFMLRAEIAAMRGDPDAAMRALETAAELGWRYTWHAEHMPYLQSLRARADYRALIARIAARNAVDGTRILELLKGSAADPPR